ncbi:MAG: Multidrug resistance protein B [Candidatus Carbobacillus altaicus]|uniref:Multidrug resistance protein B n=1 Tax=Candidatus Carbonibacillus altaicus TaxID=2163959 RepID=A0A2R6Y0A8_9BACL|nr:MAG: Multidrug resistance protein B [Candidatus Carbobacillus altaicus]
MEAKLDDAHGVNRQKHRPLILVAVLLAMFMAAVESTIVATAMPTIVGELGGFELLSMVFAVYLLTQAITIPIYGKLADLYGRKKVFLIGVAIFLLGSLLSGLSPSMEALIVFRAFQGLGAGSVMPIATTIVGDIYTREERARVQGLLSSVWGISAVVGPLLGSLIVEFGHWPWVFWINLPIGVASLVIIALFLKEHLGSGRVSLDLLGSFWMLVAIVSFLLFIMFGGKAFPWLSWQSAFLLLVFALSLWLLIREEKRAEEPMMPLQLWGMRTIAIANVATLITGSLLISLSTFLPTYMQGVMGTSARTAGYALAVMSLGWPLASTVAGRVLLVLGSRRTSLIGSVFLLLGSIFFATLSPERPVLWAMSGSFLIGVGMGFTNTAYIVTIQNSVPWNVRGVATSSNLFMRMLGGTIGASVLGAILNNVLTQFFLNHGVTGMALSENMQAINELLNQVQGLPSSDASVRAPSVVDTLLKQGLATGMHSVFLSMLVIALINMPLVYFLPREDHTMGKAHR